MQKKPAEYHIKHIAAAWTTWQDHYIAATIALMEEHQFLFRKDCQNQPCLGNLADLSSFPWSLAGLGLFHVISAFCDTPVAQNAEITQKIHTLYAVYVGAFWCRKEVHHPQQLEISMFIPDFTLRQ